METETRIYIYIYIYIYIHIYWENLPLAGPRLLKPKPYILRGRGLSKISGGSLAWWGDSLVPGCPATSLEGSGFGVKGFRLQGLGLRL